MDDLVTFLRARLDEDEATGRAAAEQGDAPWWHVMDDGLGNKIAPGSDAPPGIDVAIIRTTRSEFTDHVTHHDPARVLREVEAKRQLLGLHVLAETDWGDGFTSERCMVCDPQDPEPFYPCPTLRLLAAVYADHPDYRPEWAPTA